MNRWHFINGAHVLADISGALFWPAAETLIGADLHFEKGSAYAARGVALPPYDTAATLTRLEACRQISPQAGDIAGRCVSR